MTYEEARREARKLLRTDKAEVKELPEPVSNNDSVTGFMPYRFLVGTGRGKNFIALAAGMNWSEAIEDLRKRLNASKETRRDEKEGNQESSGSSS